MQQLQSRMLNSDRLTKSSIPFPTTEQLLQQGGDARVTVDPATGYTRYGCAYRPDPALLAFGSSTASTISEAAFSASDELRNRLERACLAGDDPATLYGRELERIRGQFLALSRLGDLTGLECIFSASGTDLHLLTALWLSGAQQTPTLIVMVDAAETGSGVATALQGCHFGTCSIFGETVEPGTALLSTASAPTVISIPLRDASGTLRTPGEIDAEMVVATERAIKAGYRVLLIPIDVSKTGIMAPSTAGVLALHQRYSKQLDVLIDGCQFRFSNATLRAYLEQGYMVAVTGSKFLSGPTFSAMLLVPGSVAARLSASPLPPELAVYSSRYEWPQGWSAARHLSKHPNFGLLLRLEATMEEFRRFRAVPEQRIAAFIERFSAAIREHTALWPELRWMEPAPLNRKPLLECDAWDTRQTIFPFLLFHGGGAKKMTPLTRAETAKIYRLLSLKQEGDALDAMRCELGQPVACGSIHATPVSALRLCLSARLLVEAAQEDGIHANAVIERAFCVLDKTRRIVMNLLG